MKKILSAVLIVFVILIPSGCKERDIPLFSGEENIKIKVKSKIKNDREYRKYLFEPGITVDPQAPFFIEYSGAASELFFSEEGKVFPLPASGPGGKVRYKFTESDGEALRSATVVCKGSFPKIFSFGFAPDRISFKREGSDVEIAENISYSRENGVDIFDILSVPCGNFMVKTGFDGVSGEKIHINISDGVDKKSYLYRCCRKNPALALYSSAFGFIPKKLEFFSDRHDAGTTLSLDIVPVEKAGFGDRALLDPVPGDIQQILAADPSGWRYPEWEVYFWESYPGILIFDTLNYDIQSRFFKRLAYFAEKRGYTGKIYSEDFLAGKPGWNGHNYLSKDLARFFSLAERDDVPLTREEAFLRELLLNCKIIEEKSAGVYSGNESTGVLSVSRQSSASLRRLLLTHEGFHGLYYSEERLRDKVLEGWRDLIPQAGEMWTDFLKTSKQWNYNYEDLYLLKNELFGYLMQQPVGDFKGYYDNIMFPRILRQCPEKSLYYTEHRDKILESFILMAQNLDSFLGTELGVVSGDLRYLKEE